MRLGWSVYVCVFALACGGDDGPASNGGLNGGSNGGTNGDDCGGGSFSLDWTGGLTGSASGDCVVTVVTGAVGTVPGEVNVSVIEERPGGSNLGLTLRINRDTLAPIQAVFTPEPGTEIGCNESDVFQMDAFDGTVEFTRREADGFELSIDINLSCSDGADVDPVDDFALRLTGTIAGSRDLTDL